jgi:hypothetical protein
MSSLQQFFGFGNLSIKQFDCLHRFQRPRYLWPRWSLGSSSCHFLNPLHRQLKGTCRAPHTLPIVEDYERESTPFCNVCQSSFSGSNASLSVFTHAGKKSSSYDNLLLDRTFKLLGCHAFLVPFRIDSKKFKTPHLPVLYRNSSRKSSRFH